MEREREKRVSVSLENHSADDSLPRYGHFAPSRFRAGGATDEPRVRGSAPPRSAGAPAASLLCPSSHPTRRRRSSQHSASFLLEIMTARALLRPRTADGTSRRRASTDGASKWARNDHKAGRDRRRFSAPPERRELGRIFLNRLNRRGSGGWCLRVGSMTTRRVADWPRLRPRDIPPGLLAASIRNSPRRHRALMAQRRSALFCASLWLACSMCASSAGVVHCERGAIGPHSVNKRFKVH